MNIEERIRKLEKERDRLLEITPDEIIKPRDEIAGRFYDYTTHIKIKKKYNTKISLLRKYGVENMSQIPSVKEKKKSKSLEKFGVDNPSKSIFIQKKARKTCLERYGVEKPQKLEQIKRKAKDTNIKRYGIHHSKRSDYRELSRKIALNPTIKKRRYKTMARNKSFNRSLVESEVGSLLKEKFNIVKSQYKSDLYPFVCDFYIPALDLYIELNFHWTHGLKPYDPLDKDDRDKRALWKSKNTKYYNTALYVWTDLDIRKLKTFKDNNLNYKIFYNKEEFYEWYKTL